MNTPFTKDGTMRIFNLGLLMALAMLGSNQSFAAENTEANEQNVATLLDSTASAEAPQATEALDATYRWTLLGCARSPNDCRYEAGNRGYYRYYAQRDLYTCRHVFHQYACYGSW